jgi:hypothetical protein
MIHQLCTLSARLIIRWLRRPRALVVPAWFWLAAQADNLDEKLRCLEAILELKPDNEPANMALLGILQQQQTPTYLHPANAEEIANIAEEAGAEVLRGDLRYPSYSGGWQLGKIDFSEHLAKDRDHEIVIVIASVGKAGEVEKEKLVCGICGFELADAGECPRCKMQIEKTARGLRRRQQRDELFREIDEIVEERWEDTD